MSEKLRLFAEFTPILSLFMGSVASRTGTMRIAEAVIIAIFTGIITAGATTFVMTQRNDVKIEALQKAVSDLGLSMEKTANSISNISDKMEKIANKNHDDISTVVEKFNSLYITHLQQHVNEAEKAKK